MRTSSVVAASAAFAAGANAWGNVTYTTEVVTAYTTYCPSPTSPTHVVHGTKTYTITEATTLTITNCPCTITKPVITKPVITSPVLPATSPAVYTSSEASSASVPIVYTSSVVISPSVPIVTVPVESASVPAESASVPVESASVPAESASVPVVTVPVPVGTGVPSSPPQGPGQPPIFYNSTVAVPPATGTGSVPVGTGAATPSSQLPSFTGAANKAFAASGAGLLSVFCLVAYLL